MKPRLSNQKLTRIVLSTTMVLMIIVSIICVKKYLNNSNTISYDLNSFNVAEGFTQQLENGELVVSPNPDRAEGQAICLESENTLLAKGVYSIGITYQSDGYNLAYMQAGDDINMQQLLPAGENTVFFDFELEEAVEDAKLRLCYNEGTNITVKTMIIKSDRPIVTDWIFILALLWGIIIAGMLYLKIFLDGELTRQHLYEIAFVVLVSLLSVPAVILLNKGIFWGVDTNAHNMRLEGLKDALLSGQFPVVIAPSMCNGYGSIAPVMYPSLFLYPFAILRILGVSPVLTYKFAHVIINVFMCSTCYVCVKKITRSSIASGIALVVFAFSRFHMTTIGIMDWTYGMGIALIFMFVVIIGIYEIFFGKKEEWPYLTIGMWGLMNSHILSTVFAAGIVGVFMIMFLSKLRRQNRLLSLVRAVAASVPICLYRIYTFLDAYSNNELNTDVLNLQYYDDTVYSFKSMLTDGLVRPVFTVTVFGGLFLIGFWKMFDKDKREFYAGALVINMICLIAMSDILPWGSIMSNKVLNSIFGNIQYASRLCQIAIPTSVVLAGVMIKSISKMYYLSEAEATARKISASAFGLRFSSEGAVTPKKIAFMSTVRAMSGTAIAICGAAVLTISVASYHTETDALRNTINVFSDKITGDIFSFPGMNDYVPEGENFDSYSGRSPYYSSEAIAIDYDSYEKSGVNISGKVSCNSDNSYIDFPVFGYKGYVCVDETGKVYKTGVGENHRLRVFFDKTEEPVFISVKYKVAGIYYVLLLLSYVSLIMMITFNKDFLARTKRRLRHYYAVPYKRMVSEK